MATTKTNNIKEIKENNNWPKIYLSNTMTPHKYCGLAIPNTNCLLNLLTTDMPKGDKDSFCYYNLHNSV